MTDSSSRRPIDGWPTRFGPGLIFALSAVGPQDFITNSIAGATQGYGLMWLLLLAVGARFVILEATARYVIATGESLVSGCGRVSKGLAWLVFGAPLIKRHFAGISQVLLLGAVAHLVYPLPTRHSSTIWSLVSWALAFALIFWGRYLWVERFSRGMAVFFGGCLAMAAIVARPRLGDVLQGAFTPALPEAGLYGSALVVVAIVGGAVGSVSNLRYGAFVHEKGWRTTADMRRQRLDLFASVASMLLMLAAIQVASAGALQPAGLEVEQVEDLVPIFGLVLGDAGRILLGASLWSAVFNNHVGASTGYGLMLADIYHRFIRPSTSIEEQDGGRGAAYLPAYRWFLVYFCVAPLYVFVTDWTPVWLVLINSAVGVILLPAVILVLMRLTFDRERLGKLANGWVANSCLFIAFVAALYLAALGAMELV